MTDGNSIREADASIISATLEHIGNYDDALSVLEAKTRKTLIIRSFFGSQYENFLAKQVSAERSYPIQQFVLDDMIYPRFKDWSAKVLQDDATESMPVVKILENGCVTRTTFLLVLERI